MADFVAALVDEARAWNSALNGCASPQLRVAGPRLAGGAREDGHNLVVILADTWCPADGAAFGCYEPNRQAITHLYTYLDPSGPHAGEIREADIEVNAVHFRWSDSGNVPGIRSLRAVLGHELGHVLGLTHACSSRTSPETLDGVTLAPCTAATSLSIMYPDPTGPDRPVVVLPSKDAVAGLCTASLSETHRP